MSRTSLIAYEICKTGHTNTNSSGTKRGSYEFNALEKTPDICMNFQEKKKKKTFKIREFRFDVPQLSHMVEMMHIVLNAWAHRIGLNQTKLWFC